MAFPDDEKIDCPSVGPISMVSDPCGVPSQLRKILIIFSQPIKLDAPSSVTASVFFTDLMVTADTLPPFWLKVKSKLLVVTGAICPLSPYTPVLKAISIYQLSSDSKAEVIRGAGLAKLMISGVLNPEYPFISKIWPSFGTIIIFSPPMGLLSKSRKNLSSDSPPDS